MLEAMGCGLPVVCTTYPPGPEIIEDGVNGLLANPSNPREFSQAIDRLLEDPSFALHIAENARCTIDKRFSLERCVNETEAFLSGVFELLTSFIRFKIRIPSISHVCQRPTCDRL